MNSTGGLSPTADRPVTDEERAKLTEAVKAQGCSRGKMKFGKKFKVDGATCANGKKHELEFDAEFKLIKKNLNDSLVRCAAAAS